MSGFWGYLAGIINISAKAENWARAGILLFQPNPQLEQEATDLFEGN